MKNNDQTKFMLEEKDLPEKYLNISFYLKKYLGKLPEPPLHPVTKKPVGPSDLAPLFPMELIKQEMTLEEFVPIPKEVREAYKLYRPSPLVRAKCLEKFLKTKAHIYFKYEGVSPVGSHKLNTALPQAFYNKKEGIKKLTTETGAGQWGCALSLATNFFGLDCTVYMVKSSFDQKPYRKTMIQVYGGKVFASPSQNTKAGKKFLKEDPDTSGSLGMAISEAVEDALNDPKAHYSLGSVLNHVLLHQTVIGLEAQKQMLKTGEYPDIIIGCFGGGSNMAGIAFPFLADKLSGKKRDLRVIAVEPKACPSFTQGEYKYDFGDTQGLTPLLKMYTLGHDFMPDPIHAGGLRYHGAAPLVSFLYDQKLIEAVAYGQKEVFEAAMVFAKVEGIIPAPESAHAIKAVIDEAKKDKKEVILFNLSGHGLLDLGAYDEFLKGNL